MYSISSKNDPMSEFDSEGQLRYLMQIEKLSMDLVQKNKTITEKENKKNKYKDLMNDLKEGKVQKDLKFWHFFEDNMFIKLTRRDSVNLTEKEIDKLTKELIALKNEIKSIKKKLIDVLINNTAVESNINDLDPHVAFLIEEEYNELISG